MRLVLATFMAALCAVCAAAQQPPVSDFARLPAAAALSLSPDGTRIAHLAHGEQGDFLIVRDTENFDVVEAVRTSEVKARDVFWAADDIVILIASDAQFVSRARRDLELRAPFSVVLSDELEIRQLMRRRRDALGIRSSTGGRLINPDQARILGIEPATGRLLIPDLDEDDRYSLFSVDPHDDRRRTVDRGSTHARDWALNEAGEPIVRVDYQERRDRFTIRVKRDGRWETVIEETTEIPSLSVYGLGPEGDLIIGARFTDPGRWGLYSLSLETGQLEGAYHVDPEYDVGAVFQDPYTNRVVGVRVDAEMPGVTWFDEELAQRQADVSASFGAGTSAMITSWSRDRQRFLITVETGVNPTIFYLYDVARDSIDPLGSTHPEAFTAGVAERMSILYPARDGTMIPAYMTMAEDVTTPAPTVVLPHGGPETRDVGGFNWIAHFLASRGYVVLQPNFRGSDGYGLEWINAGYGEWGTGVMQHDVTDGLQALIDDGIADPDRVCIVGASYGGYAALAGAAFTPDRYRCAAAIAPVTDLNDMLSTERRRLRRGSWVVDYWERAIGGDLGAARDQLRAISPAHNVETIQAPILLIHGRDDTVVPISQSREMARALRRADKPVELIELDGEDHWLSVAETRLETLEALDVFLAEHLAP